MSMMNELWTFNRNVPHDELRGLDVEARDGSIGKIDEATADVGRACLVVDTGPWIFGRKVVIPAGAVETIDVDKGKVHVSLTKDQIKNAPEFDQDRGWNDDVYRTRLGTYFDTEMRRAS